MSAETAKVGMDLYFKNRGQKQVVAVIYTHSHIDHYGGVRGVVDEADVKAGKVKIYAPAGFMEAAVAENIMAKIHEPLGYQAESGPWRNFYLTGVLELENGVLNHTANAEATNADATITLNRDTLNKIILKETTLKQAEESGALTRPTDCAVCCRVAACLIRPTKP